MDIVTAIMTGKVPYRPFKKRSEEYELQNQLIIDHRNGSETASTELLELCAPLISSTIKGGKVDDVEELALACLEIFAISLDKYKLMSEEQKVGFSAYLSAQLRTRIFEHYRDYVEDRNVVMKGNSITSGNIIDYVGREDNPVELEVIGEDLVDIDYEFYLVLDKMDGQKRKFAELYYIEGRGEQEVCDELGISYSSFMSYRSLVKKKLKQSYQEVKGDDNTL